MVTKLYECESNLDWKKKKLCDYIYARIDEYRIYWRKDYLTCINKQINEMGSEQDMDIMKNMVHHECESDYIYIRESMKMKKY